MYIIEPLMIGQNLLVVSMELPQSQVLYARELLDAVAMLFSDM